MTGLVVGGGTPGGGVCSYDGGAGDWDLMSRFSKALVGGLDGAVWAGDATLREGVALLEVAVRRGPERGDSAGRALEMVSKTESSITPFSRRFSSSCVHLVSRCALISTRAKVIVDPYILDIPERPVGLDDCLAVGRHDVLDEAGLFEAQEMDSRYGV